MVQACSLEHMLVLSVLNRYEEAVPESSCFFREAMISVHLLAGFTLVAAWLPSYYPALHLFCLSHSSLMPFSASIFISPASWPSPLTNPQGRQCVSSSNTSALIFIYFWPNDHSLCSLTSTFCISTHLSTPGPGSEHVSEASQSCLSFLAWIPSYLLHFSPLKTGVAQTESCGVVLWYNSLCLCTHIFYRQMLSLSGVWWYTMRWSHRKALVDVAFRFG